MRPLDEILADMRALLDGANGRDLTADEIEAYDKLEAELSAAQAQQLRAAPAGDGGGDGGDGGEGGDGGTASAADAQNRATRTAAIRNRVEAFNTVVIPAGVGRQNRPQDTIEAPFRNYLRTGVPNNDITDLRVAGPDQIGTVRPRNAQGEASGPAGGYLVPEGFRLKIVERMKAIGGLEQAAEVITTETGQNLPWPVIDDTANTGEVVDESAGNTSGSDVDFDFQDLGAYSYQAGGTGGNPLKLPWELMQDAAFDVEGLLSRLLGERLARKLAPHLITGTGVKQPKGILTGVTGTGTVGAAIAYADLLALITGVDKSYWPKARWLMNQTSLGLVWGIEDDNHRPIWMPGTANGSMAASLEQGTLLGYPVTLDNGMPDFDGTSGTGTNWCAFGDLQAGYVVRHVRDIAVVVNPWSSASNRQNEYTAWMRADARPQDTHAYAVGAGGP